jgi:hypothetical protein
MEDRLILPCLRHWSPKMAKLYDLVSMAASGRHSNPMAAMEQIRERLELAGPRHIRIYLRRLERAVEQALAVERESHSDGISLSQWSFITASRRQTRPVTARHSMNTHGRLDRQCISPTLMTREPIYGQVHP